MAYPTSVNDQITDAVSQSNVSIAGSAPSQALASLYQVLSSSLSLAVHNAVSNQQQMQQISLASTSSCVAFLLGDEAALGKKGATKTKVKEEKKSTKN